MLFSSDTLRSYDSIISFAGWLDKDFPKDVRFVNPIIVVLAIALLLQNNYGLFLLLQIRPSWIKWFKILQLMGWQY